MSCDDPLCNLSEWCVDLLHGGILSLCGGVIDFDKDLQGSDLGVNISVEDIFGAAGVLISTESSNSTARTNSFEIGSNSQGNSCASHNIWNEYWTDDLVVRFVVPQDDTLVQGATHLISFYVGMTWPGGIRVDFYSPDTPPWAPGAVPFYQTWTEQSGTAFIQVGLAPPIGYLVILKESDENFTIDDLEFGPIHSY